MLLLYIRILRDSGIIANARVLSDGRVELWLGDATAGIRASAVFARKELGQAARWLAARAVDLYPESRFARVQRLISRWTADARASGPAGPFKIERRAERR
jgi:hypothetical protein